MPRLRAALEKDLKPDPDAEESAGFTKDVALSKDTIEKLIQEIESATNPRKMISLEEAKQFGLNAAERK